MSCFLIDFNIPADDTGSLKKLVNDLARGDQYKAALLASYFGTNELSEFLKNEVGEGDYTKLKSNWTKLKSLINKYYNENHKRVTDSANRRQGTEYMFGFSDIQTMYNAQEHCINLIIKYYNDALINNKSANNVLSDVSTEVVENFINRYGLEDWINTKDDDAFKAKYKEEYNKLNAAKKEQLEKITKLKQSAKNVKDKEVRKSIVAEIKKARNRITMVNNQIFDILYANTMNKGNLRTKGYANLALQMKLNSNQWFDKVFNSNLINRYKSVFANTIDNEDINIRYYEDISNFRQTEENSVDMESRRWDDTSSKHSSFTETVNINTRLYLSSITHLNTPGIKDNGVWDEDTNNVLGTASIVGADYIIVQLSNFASFSSVQEFIASLERKQNIPGLEWLSKIIYDCKANKVLANQLFHELANPKMAKSIIDIVDGGISNKISNTSSDDVSYFYYNLENTSKFTIKDVFDYNSLAWLEETFNSISPQGINANTIDLYMDKQVVVLKRIIKQAFPQLELSAIDAYIKEDINKSGERIKELIGIMSDYLSAAENIIKDENTLIENYSKARRQWILNAQDPSYEVPAPKIDYSAINYGRTKPALVRLAKALAPYSPVRTELNSFNAEGNLGSDLLANNAITNLFKQIKFSTEKDQYAGLRNLGNFVLNVPQYKYSPIFWGIYDSQGNEIYQGLFKRNGDSFIINEKAKELLSTSLFNGVRNQDSSNSELYNNMSKIDYFMSMIINYYSPALSFDQQSSSDKAGYLLRTPSDAPKNFIINANKASIEGLNAVDEKSRLEYLEVRGKEVIASMNLSTEKTKAKVGRTHRTDNARPSRHTNQLELNEFLDILTKGGNINVAGRFTQANDKNTRKITYIYIEGDSKLKMTVVGNLQGNILMNTKVDSVWSNDFENKSALPTSIRQGIANYLEAEGIQNGGIKTYINREHKLFSMFSTQFLNEVNNLVFNLNNVLDASNGFAVKNDTQLLFDRYHYNGAIVEDGRLTGNVFKLNKLFDTTNTTVGKNLVDVLLYGEGGIFKNVRNKLVLNEQSNFIRIEDTNGNKEIKLNEWAIKNLINDLTEVWINDFINDINTQAAQYSTVLEDKYTPAQIQEVMLNAAFMNMNFDDLFEGDSKFYRDSRDFFKRAKEIQAGGKSYAGYDLNTPLGQGLVQKEDIEIGGVKIPLHDGFKGATIKNTVRVSDNANNIYEELLKCIDPKLPKSTRERLAHQIAKGFGYKNPRAATKTNDAQSYITIEEFIRRAYLSGTLNEYKDIIAELLNPDADISKLDIAKINKFIQVQKNFYYDKQFDANTRTMYPRQIKNAEFVLIPALIKGTSLEKLYNAMKANNIGQINTVETDKAAKRSILEFWDNDGNVSDEALAKFNTDLADNANTENYYYRYLYKQQQVAQHMMDAKNKAGVQIMKKVLDNLDTNIEEINTAVDNYFNAYVANISSAFNSFINKMGWTVVDGRIVDKRGFGKLNFKKFYDKAKAESERLGLDSNFADYVTTDIYGNPLMPNWLSISAAKFESVAQSMFNNSITRQKLPGWHAAQITSVGYDANLKFDAETGVMEVLIPRWAANIPKTATKEEEKAILEKLNKEQLNFHIGYRIPTEGKQSIAVLKVVGFLDDVQGSTIVVPDEWVTKTGSDFDVDSVYGICYKFDYDTKTQTFKKIEYIPGTTPSDVHKRYLKRLNDDIRALLKEDAQKVYRVLSIGTSNVSKPSDIIKLLATKNGINHIVESLDLITEEDFSNLSYDEQQSDDARNNRILDSILDIMLHPSTLEENYSRSNFDALTDAKKIIDNLRKIHFGEQNHVESIYNPNDQITYMENATSGMSLKAFSVTRDTFNSVSNFTHAALSKENGIDVAYDNSIISYQEAVQRFGEKNVRKLGNKVIITHTQWGWSNDNRNVIGEYVTVYSSQTTAHILDAVKEGSIFNENKFTFGTFKTLLDLGIDYETAIGFLQQPAITEIVNEYNKVNSVYAEVNGNPIDAALNNIAVAAGFKSFEDMANDENVKEYVRELTGGTITKYGTLNDGIIILDKEALKSRFYEGRILESDENYNTETAVKDILNVIKFKQINAVTNNVEKIIRCTNPDKFGAKQSIFATKTVINNIISYLTEQSDIGDTLKVGDVSVLEAIYPGITENNINVNSSKYKYLAAFMKYATIASADINSQLFKLNSDINYNLMMDIAKSANFKFNEDKAIEFNSYVVEEIYNSIADFYTPFTINEYGWFAPIINDIYNNNDSVSSNEINRLNGYTQYESINLNISDLLNPTQEDIVKFHKLTPAQKVIFIQQHFEQENLGIFEYLKTNRFKERDILRYNDTIGDIENIYTAFNNSFFNKNALIQLATLDLIKYAFVVEGFKFKKGSISKIICNDALIASQEQKGLDIVSKLQREFDNFKIDSDFSDKFIRSHSEYIPTTYIGKPTPGTFSNYIERCFNIRDGILYIPNQDTEAFNTIRKRLKIDIQDGNVLDTIKYIKLNRKINKTRRNIVYKLKYDSNGNIYGYPINTLDSNEHTDYSYINENNKYKREEYYETIIDKFINNEDYKSIESKDYIIPVRKAKTVATTETNANLLLDLADSSNKHEQAQANKFIQDIVDWYNSPVKEWNGTIVYNDMAALRTAIRPGKNVRINIPIDGQNILFEIKREKIPANVYKKLNGKRVKNITAKEQEMLDIINQSGNKYPSLYGVEVAVSNNVESTNAADNFQYDTLFGEEDDTMYSTTGLISEEEYIIENNFEQIHQTAKDIVDTIAYADRTNSNENTKQFMDTVHEIDLDNKNSESIKNNVYDIYDAAATYYENIAADMVHKIDNFVINDETGESYSIGDKALYEKLVDDDTKYNELIKLILDISTFGKQFEDIYRLDLKGEDAVTSRNIERIKNAIDKIRNNVAGKNAMKHIFNIYLAETVSSNTNIRHGLINLDMTFNDAGYIDSHIADIGFINKNIVQTVVKYINSKLNAVEMFDVPTLVAEYEKEFDRIMSLAGTIDWNKIVDEKGRLTKEYTDELIETRNRLFEAVREARKNGYNTAEYWNAKLARDKFLIDNIEQPLVKDYYLHKYNNEKRTFENAPQEFLEYQSILSELRTISGNTAELSRDELIKRKELINRLSYFTSKYDMEGNEKPLAVQDRLKYITKYKLRKKEITENYFDTKISDEIKDTIRTYVDYIKAYDTAHPELSLSEKLDNERYKEAYDWLQYNTVRSFDEQTEIALADAYSKFNQGENDKKIQILKILKGKDVYDEYGNLDPSKISQEDIKRIKDLYTTDKSKLYEEENGDTSIIKLVSKPAVIGTQEYYNVFEMIFGDMEVNTEKAKYAKLINDTMFKGFDENGNFKIDLFFNNCTIEELTKLEENILIYNTYDDGGLSKEEASQINKISKKVVKGKRYAADVKWANNNLSKEQLRLFHGIFSARRADGKFIIKNEHRVPNNAFYSYRIPKESVRDDEKSIAKQFINETVEYKPTDKYYETYKKYKQLGEERGDNTFIDWYNNNHIFNSTTHKMEPLSIWKERTINRNNTTSSFEYNPVFDLTEKEAKYTNNKFNPDDKVNYNGSSQYASNLNLNDKEKAMRALFKNVLNRQASTRTMERKAEEGFMPRRPKIIKDARWYVRNIAGSFGLDWQSQHDKTWSDKVTYETDRDADFSIIQELKKQGTVDIRNIKREDYKTEEEYKKAINDAKINNAKIDAEIRDNDWNNIMKDYIEKSTIYNAKEKLKYTSLLLIEQLKNNEAIKVNYKGNVSTNERSSTNYNQVSNTVDQHNTIAIVENWHKRLFRNQFKTKSLFNGPASLLQNLTSAKYMIFNVTGGIANIWTGLGNILGETLAGDFFNNKEFALANKQYAGGLYSYFADMYSEKKSNFTSALIDFFNVVDYEAFSERRPNEKTSEYIKRFRNWMYGLQSSGEHYMQNTVLLAMLKSHKIYENEKGKLVVGSYNNYIWETERQVLKNLLKKDELLYSQYIAFISDIKNNDNEIHRIETGKTDINREFLKLINDSELTKKYIAAKEEALDKAKENFNKLQSLETLFTFKDGRAVFDENAGISKEQIGAFKNKVIYVNKKIHGVYDKIGAAQIEKHWWGTLVMQYHKHLYPGFMKRWRINAYYNEQTEQWEKGSYISAINLLTMDFDKAFKVAKDDAQGKQALMIMKSIQNLSIQAVNNLRAIKTNYALLPKWEQNNIRRAYADSLNTLACIMMAIAIHGLWDDDELKDSDLLSTGVYLADRFASEAQAFTPWGFYGEAKTLYSSPVASLNSPGDLLKLIGLTGQLLIDPDFETNYSRGLYKGRNKFEVLLTRNLPIVRVKNRLEMMSKNNQYYRLNQNMLKIIPVQQIGEAIRE